MENTPATPRKKISNTENARWACLLIFIVAVGAALLYVSSEKHSTGTLVLLGAVLLVGQICATIPWIISAQKNANAANAGTAFSEKIDSCMAKSFANQEIIHKEIHAVTETLLTRIESANTDVLKKSISESDIEKIAEIISQKIRSAVPAPTQIDAEEITTPLTEEIQKADESIKQLTEEFSRILEEQVGAINARIDSTKSEPINIKAINERLDTLAINQENILEKLEALEILPDDEIDDEEESDENASDLSIEDGDEDESFPLPENMLARAQAANASAGTVVGKMISENTKQETSEEEPDAGILEPEEKTETEDLQDAPEESVPAEDEIEEENKIEIPETPTTPEGELPLIEDLPHTALILKANFNTGEKPFLRGKAPGLSPKKSTPMEYFGNGRWRFDFGPMKDPAQIMIFRNDTNEALGDPFMLPAGKITTLAFDPNA